MRWRILLLVASARLALGLQFQTLASTSEYLIRDFALDYAQIGTLIGLFMWPGLLLAIPAGMAGRWFSDRALTSLGLGLIALGGVVAALAGGEIQIGIGRFICGTGFVLSTIYCTKMITDWFTGREIATALGILVMTWPLGIAIGQTGHEWLAANVGWSAAFMAASAYAILATLLIAIFYRPPEHATGVARTSHASRFSRAEWILIAPAAMVWALFNAGYVVYLSFASKVLVAGGTPALTAAAIISVASYVMMGSGIICGQVADRTKRYDLLLYIGMASAIVALILLPRSGMALLSSLMFGLLGMAPAGIIMALVGQAMRPENRAFGMGIFFSIYFLVTAPAPTIAGWLFDRSGDAFQPVLFAAVLFGLTALFNLVFRMLQRRVPLDTPA